MIIFQIIAVLFALFMIYVVSIHRKKKTLALPEVSFWYSTWALFALLALFPSLLEGITTTLHFARVFDLLVVIALMVLTVLVFRSYFSQKETMKKIEQLIREQAITSLTRKDKKA